MKRQPAAKTTGKEKAAPAPEIVNALPEVKVLQLSDIRPDPENPRCITSEAMQGLKESLRGFGMIDLPVINKRNMTIVNGHQRFRALQELGVQKALCLVIDQDPNKARLINVALNNQQIMGTWTDSIRQMLDQMREDFPDQFIALKLDALRKDVATQTDKLQVIRKKKEKMTVSSVFQVMVKCDDEKHQKRVCDDLTEQGYDCQAVTL